MASRPPAPGDLELVRQFVNTLDVECAIDQIGSREGLTVWYREKGLMASGAEVSDEQLAEAREVREALRRLLFANHGEPPAPDAIETMNRAFTSLPLVPALAPDGGPSLRPSGRGARGALARILAIVFASMAEGTWSRLKICRSDSCLWAFYDHSRNRSGHWCSMAVCGNRTKVRAYARRARERAVTEGAQKNP